MLRSLILSIGALAGLSVLAQDRCTSHTITERWLQAHGQTTDLRAFADQSPRGRAKGGQLNIPVAVHVVYNTAAENVSDAAIQGILATMNADYNGLNSDYNDVRAAFANARGVAGINFCLASVDPNGNPTTGITRTFTNQTWFDPDNETDVMKSAPDGIAPWDPYSYLNIWICDITSGAQSNLITVGYAYLPYGGMVGSAIDGLVVDYLYGTQPGDRTATHEVGHYLGLLHPWGDGTCSNGDGVADTPNTDSPTFECTNTTLMKCGVLTQYENFMDYSDCTMMFTDGQVSLMQGTLTGVRNGLLTSEGCGGGVPVEGCIPTSANGTNDGDFIDNVLVGTIANLGSGSQGGPTYTDYTAQFATSMAPNGQYTIYVTSGTYESDNYGVWVDFDADGGFAASELVGSFTSAAAGETWAITFTVPANAQLGATVMRVRGVYFDTNEPNPIDPCFNYNYGETEDYRVDIIAPVGPTPCLPTSVNGTNDGDYVDGVVLEGINNTGSGFTGGATYQDYTGLQTMLTRGEPYTLSVTSGDYTQDIVSAWIDFNDDGTFDAGELVGETLTSAAFTTTDFPFTVPADATLGLVRMRVRCVFPDVNAGEPQASDPCANFSWGETEDYGVDIESSTGITPRTDGQLGIINADGQATVKWAQPGRQQQLLVVDAAGRVVLDARPVTNSYTFPTSALSTGIYQVVVLADGQRWVGRLPRVSE